MARSIVMQSEKSGRVLQHPRPMDAWIALSGHLYRLGSETMRVMVAVLSPWVRFSGREPYVLPEDKPIVDRWNERLGPDDPRRLELHVLPEPFLGYHDAPVLILMANPGSVPADRRIDRGWVTAANQQALAAPGGTVMYSLDDKAATFPGGLWWRRMTRRLLAPGRTYADLAARLLVVQWHGYHSARPSLPPERLPSQDFAVDLVARAMDRQAPIIIGTAGSFWRSRVPGLGAYPGLIAKNSPQAMSLSERNLGSGYAAVSAALN